MKSSPEKPEKKKESALSFAIAIAIALTIRWALFEAYVIPSGSMLPTLLIHDHIFVNKFIYGLRLPFSSTWLARFKAPERGEVIVFRSPEDNGLFLIKRIIGVPGDEISYDDNGLTVNGQLVERTPAQNTADFDAVPNSDLEGEKEAHIHYTEHLNGHNHSMLTRPYRDPSMGMTKVPPGHMFVMGDHRDNSKDSRFIGFVPEDNILGRAMFIWMTCDDMLPVVSVVCNPLEIRWKRLLRSVD